MKDLKEKLENIIISLMTSHDDSDNNDFYVCKNIEEYLYYIDSIRFIELITTVESEFNIEIDNEDLVEENVKNFDRFMQLISKYVKWEGFLICLIKNFIATSILLSTYGSYRR